MGGFGTACRSLPDPTALEYETSLGGGGYPASAVVHCSRDQKHYCIGLEFKPLSVRDAPLIDRLFQGSRGPTP